MKLIIEDSDNGAILDYPDYYEDSGEEFRRKLVFKFNEEELEGLIEMLGEIIEQLGFDGSKYSREKISMKIVHGSKYECNDKECKICRGEE